MKQNTKPSRHATELLTAISNGRKDELQERLDLAADDCRSTSGLAPFDQESFELLEACVEGLQSSVISSARGKVIVQILLHLAGTEKPEVAQKPKLFLVRKDSQSTANASSHR